MYDEDVSPTWFFFPGNIYNLALPDKKISNSKNFVPVGFCGPKALTKIWDFVAGMDFWHLMNFKQNVSDAWFLPKQ